MDVLHALLEVPADLACPRDRAALFAIATFVLTSKELHELALCDTAKRARTLKAREEAALAKFINWRDELDRREKALDQREKREKDKT